MYPEFESLMKEVITNNFKELSVISEGSIRIKEKVKSDFENSNVIYLLLGLHVFQHGEKQTSLLHLWH